MEESTLPPIPPIQKTNKQIKYYNLNHNDDSFIDDWQNFEQTRLTLQRFTVNLKYK